VRDRNFVSGHSLFTENEGLIFIFTYRKAESATHIVTYPPGDREEVLPLDFLYDVYLNQYVSFFDNKFISKGSPGKTILLLSTMLTTR